MQSWTILCKHICSTYPQKNCLYFCSNVCRIGAATIMPYRRFSGYYKNGAIVCLSLFSIHGAVILRKSKQNNTTIRKAQKEWQALQKCLPFLNFV